jgi:hypothetical protein
MAANPNVGAEAQPGAEGTPSQPVSQQAPAPIESDVTKLLAGLGEKFDGLQKELRGLQGRQDKAENNFQAQLARFNQIKTQGNLSDDQAMAEMQRVDTEAQWRQNLEKKLDDLAGRIASGGTQANGQQAVAKVFEAVGLDVKDPRVASALLKQYQSAEEVELAAYRLQHQIQQSPNPTPAQNSSLPGNGSSGAASLDAIYAQYAEAFKNPTQNAELLKSLETQMRQLGG